MWIAQKDKKSSWKKPFFMFKLKEQIPSLFAYNVIKVIESLDKIAIEC